MRFREFIPATLIVVCAVVFITGAVMLGRWPGPSFALMRVSSYAGLIVSVSAAMYSMMHLFAAKDRRPVIASVLTLLLSLGYIAAFYGLRMLLAH